MENQHPEHLSAETEFPEEETQQPQPSGESSARQEPSQEEEPQPTGEKGYVPRPAWQVWMARIGLALFILVILLYYLKMMRSGL